MTAELQQYAKTSKGLIIRAFGLKKGDIFKRLGQRYLVISITGGQIWYVNYRNHPKRIGPDGSIGQFSQEWIEVFQCK